MSREVSVCIPAWRAEPFIERTLRHAADQTHAALRILVSVDQSDDATVALCQAQARLDARIEVFDQPHRLGWAGNVNFLLERVETPFFFLYFHDDVIQPAYVEHLLGTLESAPAAASAHCDMGHFGATSSVSVGRSYDGDVTRRLLVFLTAPQRGSPLRSLVRRDAVGDSLRLPTEAIGGFWANEPFLMRLVAAGPALHLPETLYLRWDQRAGGLTDGWKKLTPAQVISGFKTNAALFVSILQEQSVAEAEMEVLMFALATHLMARVRMNERALGSRLFATAADLHPAFATVQMPEDLSLLAEDVRGWLLEGHRNLQRASARAPL